MEDPFLSRRHIGLGMKLTYLFIERKGDFSSDTTVPRAMENGLVTVCEKWLQVHSKGGKICCTSTDLSSPTLKWDPSWPYLQHQKLGQS